jgi:large subunit ribosomal protein L21
MRGRIPAENLLPASDGRGNFHDPFGKIMAYAIIQTGGRQFRVQPGDVIDVELLDVEAGKKTTFDEVLLASDDSGVKIGTPLVQGAKVTAEVLAEEHKAPKVVSYKFKRRKGYHRTVGHRQKLTRVKVSDIKA